MLTLPAVLTHAVAAKFDYAAPVQAAGGTVVVDAAGLMQFDSSALAILLEYRRQAMVAGSGFATANAPAKLLQLAAVYGVEALITGQPVPTGSRPS